MQVTCYHVQSQPPLFDVALECCYYVFYWDGTTKHPKTQKKQPQQPSRKLGKTCISQVYVTKFSSGKMEVKFISAHSNHNPDEDVAGFVPLPVSTKQQITMDFDLYVVAKVRYCPQVSLQTLSITARHSCGLKYTLHVLMCTRKAKHTSQEHLRVVMYSTRGFRVYKTWGLSCTARVFSQNVRWCCAVFIHTVAIINLPRYFKLENNCEDNNLPLKFLDLAILSYRENFICVVLIH